MRLQHDGPMTGGRRLVRAASNASTDRARCGSGPKWQCRSAAPARSTLTSASVDRSLLGSDTHVRSLRAGRFPRPDKPRSSRRMRPRCCGATRRSSAIASRSSSTIGGGRTPSTSRSRAGSRRCSSSASRRRAAARRGVARQHARLPVRVRRGGVDRCGDRRPQPHPPGRASRCATQHTHCGLVITEPRHEALLARSPTGFPRSSRRRASRCPTIRRRHSVNRWPTRSHPRGRRRSRDRARHRLDLGVDLHVGHLRRAEGRDLLATAAARDGQADDDDHGPRPRRRRLRVHAALPFERGAGRMGAVAGHAVRGRAGPALLGVALARRRAPVRRDVLQLHGQAARVSARATRARPTTPTTRCGSRSATKDRPRSSTPSRAASASR